MAGMYGPELDWYYRSDSEWPAKHIANSRLFFVYVCWHEMSERKKEDLDQIELELGPRHEY